MRDNPNQVKFNWNQSRANRDVGIAKVLGNTPEWWRNNCYRLLQDRPAAMIVPFTAEDFCRYAAPLIGHPHHHNAWGAVWHWSVKFGYIVPTGEWRHMKKVTSNGRKTPLYRWP